jgi:hypothetical protein
MEILGRNNKKSTNICCIIRKQYVINKIACDDTIAVSLNCPFLISLSVFSNNYYKTRYIFLSGCADLFTFKENSIVLRDTIDYELYNFCKLTVKVNMNEQPDTRINCMHQMHISFILQQVGGFLYQ